MAGDELPSDWEIDFEKRKAVPNHSREKIKSLGSDAKEKLSLDPSTVKDCASTPA
jgi:hypothetical protein